MSAFDYIDGKKVDLGNPVHRDVIIQRNKALQHAVENGLDIEYGYDSKCKVVVRITTEIQCLKCGDNITENKDEDFEDVVDNLESYIPTVKCDNCGTKYSYYVHDGDFCVTLPKPQIPKPIYDKAETKK